MALTKSAGSLRMSESARIWREVSPSRASTTGGHNPAEPKFRNGSSKRVTQAAEVIGICSVLVHALSPEAKAFYLAVGFEGSPLEPMTLMATLADIQAATQSA
jgi:hypothetical protein